MIRHRFIAPLSIALLLSAVPVALPSALPGASPSVRAANITAAKTKITDLRICGPDAFDERGNRCRRDQSSAALRTGRFFCSATVVAAGDRQFRGNFVFAGKPLPEVKQTLPRASSVRVYHFFFTGAKELPGGTWACEIKVGDVTASKSFRSAGPRTTATDLAVCEKSDTDKVGEVDVCTLDRGSEPFEEAKEIACSVTLVNLEGRTLRWELTYNGRLEGYQSFGKNTLPVVAVGGFVNANPGTTLPPGKYECRFLADGQNVARKSFAIAASS